MHFGVLAACVGGMLANDVATYDTPIKSYEQSAAIERKCAISLRLSEAGAELPGVCKWSGFRFYPGSVSLGQVNYPETAGASVEVVARQDEADAASRRNMITLAGSEGGVTIWAFAVGLMSLRGLKRPGY